MALGLLLWLDKSLWECQFDVLGFSIASLSYIFSFSRSCSVSAIIIGVSVYCAWFYDAPYPWSAAVDFLWVWWHLYAWENWSLKFFQFFWTTWISYHFSHDFSIPLVLRIINYSTLTTFPPGVGVFVASVNSIPSSIFSYKSTIGSRKYHYCFIFCSLSLMPMGEIFPWSSYRWWMRPASVQLA